MKIMLSLNRKFFKISPNELINLIEKSNQNSTISGFECVANNENEQEYIKELSRISKEKYIVNLHSPCYQEIEKIGNYLDFANNISNIQNRKVNIVFHPKNEANIEESILKTSKKLENIFNYIENKNYKNNVEISLENLNDLNGKKRLKKESFTSLFNEYKNLKFTYDIGHEIVDKTINYELDEKFVERLNNFHIHTFNKVNNEDHYSIESLEENNNIKVLLEKYGKDKTVVLEYALDYIKGNAFEEKIKNYVESAQIITSAL